MNADVYFIGANWPALKKNSFPWVCAKLATALTGSQILHVSIGDDRLVGSCSAKHTSVHPKAVYRASHPSIIGWFEVPIARPINPIRVGYMRRITSILPTLLAWATSGWFPCHNCVTVVADVLREGGIEVPRSVYSPKRLERYLRKEGCKWVSLKQR